jgi:hypothetical protein
MLSTCVRTPRLLAGVALAAVLALAAPRPAHAGNVRFPFKNATAYPVIVVMDSHREVHRIEPGGVADFNQANAGDAPTFHVHLVNPDGSEGTEIGVDKFHTIRIHGFPPHPDVGGRDLTWDGSKIQD